MRSPKNIALLVLGCVLLSIASIAKATPRLADSFQYPIGGFVLGSVTAAQDQVDDFYCALDFSAPGSVENAGALHAGEDWRRNDTSTVERAPDIRAIAGGEVVARSTLYRTVLIRHYVPMGTLANVPESPRLPGAQELYSLYRNVESFFFFVRTFNSQTDPDSPPVNIGRGSLLGRTYLASGPEMHLELYTTEPDFDALNANWPDIEDLYADMDALNSDGLIDPSEFIDKHRSIDITRGPQMYIHQTSGNRDLHQLDVLTGDLTRLTRLSRSPEDIAFSPSGELYAISFGDLYKIDLTTAGSTQIGRHGISLARSLVFSETGELFGVGGLLSWEVFQLDLTTGAATSLGELGYSPGALAFHQGELFMATRTVTGSSTSYLVKLELEPSLRVIEVGGFGVTGVSALASAPDGKLYATRGTQVFEVNPATAEITPISDFAGQLLTGVTASGFFTEAGAPQTVLASAILPSSRSVTVGSTATAFVSVINTGGIAATGCTIASPSTSSSFSLEFQSTDPATNAPVGERNVPVNIPAGGVATFVIYLQSTLERLSFGTPFNLGCENTELANSITGVNTLLYSVTEEPVPDIVALSATANNDGVVTLDSDSGIGAFALASVNVGATDEIIVTVDTGSANKLPLQLSLCETGSVGQCINGASSPTVTTTIDAGATPTFSVFLTAQGDIAFRPDRNRIYIRFRDSTGTIRGSTSVAVHAQ